MVIKRMSGDSSQMQTENSFCNESLSVEVESSNNEESFMENENQSYEISLENEHTKKSNHDVTNDVQVMIIYFIKIYKIYGIGS